MAVNQNSITSVVHYLLNDLLYMDLVQLKKENLGYCAVLLSLDGWLFSGRAA